MVMELQRFLLFACLAVSGTARRPVGVGSASGVLALSVVRLSGSVRHGSPEPVVVGSRLLAGCNSSFAASSAISAWVAKRQEAMQLLCADPENRPYMDVYVDERFQKNYANIYGADGWVEKAWVTYLKVRPGNTDFLHLTRKLVESVHLFSQYPIILMNFGQASTELDPELFPRLVQFNALDLSNRHLSFNFNKFQALLLAKVKVGASLDSDMMMANPQADSLLSRTQEEITEQYPYPMMPVHFLDRDPANLKYYDGKGNYLVYNCIGCPKPTMRWGQAQPTWTYWSLPFFARWQVAKIAERSEQGVPTAHIAEDEDLLNVALWQEGASKQWCMWQTGGVGFVKDNLYAQHPFGVKWNADKSRYLNGTPMGLYFGHAEKKWRKVAEALDFLQQQNKSYKPKAFYHNFMFYGSFEELVQANPGVETLCTL